MRAAARPFNEWHKPANNGCWLWQGTVNSSGYGNKYFNGKMETAHRIAWVLQHGQIPVGLQVLHYCDVRCCVNPDHLFLGTQKENIQDAIKKQRLRTKLNPEAVRKIRVLRKRGLTLQEIGDQFGVVKQAIHAVINRKWWRHVT